MITIRKSDDRGHFDLGWLDTRHTFSFGEYYDPAHMHFRTLRVMNEDIVQPGRGFGTHPHRDMEIITCILSGQLQHKDSLGHGSIITPGRLQRMTAGTGIEHSEFNPSQTEPVHLYQIWILPHTKGLKPGYEEKTFSSDTRRNQLQLVASSDGRDGSLTIHQDARIYLSDLASGESLTHSLAPGRHAWLQLMTGAIVLSDHTMEAGDGAAVSDETTLRIIASQESQIMLFDLA